MNTYLSMGKHEFVRNSIAKKARLPVSAVRLLIFFIKWLVYMNAIYKDD